MQIEIQVAGVGHAGSRRTSAIRFDFFVDKLRCETDPADVQADMENGADNFVVLDVRSNR